MGRKIEMVGRSLKMHKHDQTEDDINYWLKKSAAERLNAVTFLTVNSLSEAFGELKTEVIESKEVLYPMFKRFYDYLNKYNVEYLTVGGYAMAYFGMPRYTDDLDIWINPSQGNMSLLSSALIGLGPNLLMDAILQDNPEQGGVRFGTKPMAVDVHLSMAGLDFETAFANRDVVQVSDRRIPFISKDDFILNKLSSNRIQDVVDGKIIQSGRGK